MIISIGTIGIDTTRTPFETFKDILGGAATYSSLAASFFNKTSIIAVIGNDLPKKHMDTLKERLDTSGIKIVKDGKTFRYDSTFDYDFTSRTTNKTELNVIENFKPEIPKPLRKTDYVYLGNNDPEQNIHALKQFESPRITACDTIEYWIENKRDKLVEMIGMVDITILNDDEARMLTKRHNLVKAAKKIMGWGAKTVIIKKGEHGTLMFNGNTIFPAPGFPLEDVIDPTGAGDSFAGGFLGHISRTGKHDLNTIKEAIVYGNVMGSFAVEGAGINKFLAINLEDIEKRYQKYRNIVKF